MFNKKKSDRELKELGGKIVVAQIHTRHPERYVLHNTYDGTKWSLDAEGRWRQVHEEDDEKGFQS